MAGAIRDFLPGSTKPVIAYVSPYAPHITALLNQQGVPAFTEPESCAVALNSMLSAAKKITPIPLALLGENVIVPELPQGSLDEDQAKQWFSCFGILSVRATIACDAASSE